MSHDTIIVGAGLNGLVAAATLARGRRRVLVLDKEGRAGGTLATDDIGPAFRCPAAHATLDLLHPSIVDELGLDGHGLRTIRGGPTLMLRPGETPHVFPAENTAAAFEELRCGGPAYRELERLLGKIAAALDAVLTEPLPPVEPHGLGDLFELLTLGWRLRRLGRRDMPEALRLLPMALRDVAEERFDDELACAAITFPGLTASWLGPLSPGSALSLLLHRPAWRSSLFAAPRFITGGPGALAAALTAAARAAGAEIRTGAEVSRINADDDRTIGVTLADGERIPAQTVLSAIDPRTTLIELLEPGWLEPELVSAAANIRARGTVSILRFGLETLPDFGVEPAALGGRLRLGPTIEYQERAFDNAKYGTVPQEPLLELTIPSLTDPALAPTDKHVMHAWVQYTPYDLRGDSWEGRRANLIESVTAAIEGCAPGFRDTVAHVDALTPTDIEARWGLAGGHLYHAEIALDQVFHMRPIPGWFDYRTPLEGLYLCGPGCHPAGGVTGLPGRNAARRVLRDARPRD